jgi:hypothetical protein
LIFLEVENKSATPYSSKRCREDPEKVEDYFPFPPPPFSLSTVLGLCENQKRIDKDHREK